MKRKYESPVAKLLTKEDLIKMLLEDDRQKKKAKLKNNMLSSK